MRGFSLVELSIVLVVLGLLTGGILAGQSLIRAAELRSVTTEYQRYVAAAQAFRNKYMGIPGDMNNATMFWGKDAAACNADTQPAGTPGTCNGNGNGVVNTSGVANGTNEAFQFWKQLALAGLIEGSYSGLSSAAGTFHTVAQNSPTSRLNNAYWTAMRRLITDESGTTIFFTLEYGNTFQFGAAHSTDSANRPVLRPEEAWGIDIKVDDGRPGYGKLVAGRYSTCTDGADTNARNSNYLLTSNSLGCILVFADQF